MEKILTDDIKDFLYVRKGAFHKKYAPLDGRYSTMRAAINLFLQRGGKTIVETGCQRQKNDWGAGNSTQIFCEILKNYGGHLYTVDISQDNLNLAKSINEEHGVANFTCMDSVEYLKQFTKTIDLLYLDSWDYPAEQLPDWNGTADYPMEHDEIITTFHDLIDGCQQHCVQELEAASPRLHNESVILIDDNNFPGGGKARIAREWLFDNNWELILDEQQTLWSQR